MSSANDQTVQPQEAELAAITRTARVWSYRVLIVIGIGLIAWQGTVATRLAKEQKNQRLRSELIIASDQAAMVACDQEHKITVANIAAERLFGWTRSEMIGKPILMLMPEEMRSAHGDAMQDAERRAMEMPGDWMIRKNLTAEALKRDGTTVPVDLQIRTIKYGGRVEFIAKMAVVDAPKPTIEVQPLPKVEPVPQSAK